MPAVRGNHDYARVHRIAPFAARLGDADIEVLANRGVQLRDDRHVAGVGAPYTSSQYGDRFLAGWVEGPARRYVSRGLGVSTLPVRVNCPADLTVLDRLPIACRSPEDARPGSRQPWAASSCSSSA